MKDDFTNNLDFACFAVDMARCAQREWSALSGRSSEIIAERPLSTIVQVDGLGQYERIFAT